MLAAGATCACSAEPASGGSSSFGGALGAAAGGVASDDAEGGGVASVEVSASAPGGGVDAVVRGSAEGGASAAGQGSAGAGLMGSADDCDLDGFARDFTEALAKSTAPSGCAMPIAGAPIGEGQTVTSAALDFVASTYAESPGAFTFTLDSCGTPRTATCANLFDKYAGSSGGNLWILAHPFSETIERCSTGIELSAWSMTKDGITSGTFFCLIGDRGGQALGYCVFDEAGCAAKRH